MYKKRFICTFRLVFSPRNVHFKRYLHISIFRSNCFTWPLRIGQTLKPQSYFRPASPSNAVSESAAVSAAWAKIGGCRDARIRECIEKTEKRFTSSSRCSQVHRDDGFFINSVISLHSILSKLLRSEATGRVWGVLSPI